MYGCESWTIRKLSGEELMLSNCGAREDSWESLGQQGDQTSGCWWKSSLNIHWKDWCWSWNSNTLATWCEELTHLRRPWCWERLKAGGEGDGRGWDDWMVSLIQWTWVLSKLRELVIDRDACHAAVHGSQRVGHDWEIELNWIHHHNCTKTILCFPKVLFVLSVLRFEFLFHGL